MIHLKTDCVCIILPQKHKYLEGFTYLKNNFYVEMVKIRINQCLHYFVSNVLFTKNI